jgi:quercetin dioxygenase-like cupin family protein
MFHFRMAIRSSRSIRPTRRTFLRAAPLAAAAGFSLAETRLSAEPPAPVPFKLFTAADLAAKKGALAAKPGNDNLFDAPSIPLAVVLTTEVAKSAREFEWHEGRDHVVQIVDGTTKYELGGTPQGAHSPKPSEWNAPASTGSTTLLLKKGDMLVIPRGTPHKRSTTESVTFILISSSGMLM